MSGANRPNSLTGVDLDRMTEGIGNTIHSPDTVRSGSVEFSRDDNRKVLSQPMLREIRALMETLELIEQKKKKEKEDWIALLKEKTRQMRPDYL